jgi:hypothetical protein
MCIVSLCTNIASASVSNVNIVCYVYTDSSHLPNIVSDTDISPQFLHSKLSIPGTGSSAPIYKICQHQQKT